MNINQQELEKYDINFVTSNVFFELLEQFFFTDYFKVYMYDYKTAKSKTASNENNLLVHQ